MDSAVFAPIHHFWCHSEAWGQDLVSHGYIKAAISQSDCSECTRELSGCLHLGLTNLLTLQGRGIYTQTEQPCWFRLLNEKCLRNLKTPKAKKKKFTLLILECFDRPTVCSVRNISVWRFYFMCTQLFCLMDMNYTIKSVCQQYVKPQPLPQHHLPISKISALSWGQNWQTSVLELKRRGTA